MSLPDPIAYRDAPAKYHQANNRKPDHGDKRFILTDPLREQNRNNEGVQQRNRQPEYGRNSEYNVEYDHDDEDNDWYVWHMNHAPFSFQYGCMQ